MQLLPSSGADFGLLVTLLIAVNCLSLALYQPQFADDEGRNQALKVLGKGGRVLGRRARAAVACGAGVCLYSPIVQKERNGNEGSLWGCGALPPAEMAHITHKINLSCRLSIPLCLLASRGHAMLYSSEIWP